MSTISSRARATLSALAIAAACTVSTGATPGAAQAEEGLPESPGVQSAATYPYQDPSLPVATRVADLLGRMSLDEKIGQMTQAERGSATAADVTNYRLGSILSGGGSTPSSNTPTAWADMVDGFQNGALATPLRIPMIYGADAVHGHNNV